MACNCNSDGEWYDITEDSTFYLMAQLRVPATNELAIVDDVSHFRIDVYDVTDEDEGTQVIEGENEYPVTPYAEYVFSIPQTDSRWTKDSIGYNFAFPFMLDDADKFYRVEA